MPVGVDSMRIDGRAVLSKEAIKALTQAVVVIAQPSIAAVDMALVPDIALEEGVGSCDVETVRFIHRCSRIVPTGAMTYRRG